MQCLPTAAAAPDHTVHSTVHGYSSICLGLGLGLGVMVISTREAMQGNNPFIPLDQHNELEWRLHRNENRESRFITVCTVCTVGTFYIRDSGIYKGTERRRSYNSSLPSVFVFILKVSVTVNVTACYSRKKLGISENPVYTYGLAQAAYKR